MLVGKIDLTALDEGVRDDAGTHVQDISFTDDDVGILTGFDGACPVANAQYPCGIERDGGKSLLLGQSVSGGSSGVEGQVLAAVLTVGIIDSE